MCDELFVPQIRDAQFVACSHGCRPQVSATSIPVAGRTAAASWKPDRPLVRSSARSIVARSAPISGGYQHLAAHAYVNARQLLAPAPRTSRGSSDYVADPTQPIARWPRVPARLAGPVGGLIDRLEDRDQPSLQVSVTGRCQLHLARVAGQAGLRPVRARVGGSAATAASCADVQPHRALPKCSFLGDGAEIAEMAQFHRLRPVVYQSHRNRYFWISGVLPYLQSHRLR